MYPFPVVIPHDYWDGSAATAAELVPSNVCINIVKSFEGLRLKAYDDGGGRRTIGYGHAWGVRADEVIDEEEAEKLLLQDLSNAKVALVGRVLLPIKQHQFDGLCSFAFNVGTMRFGASDVLRAVNSNDWEKADRCIRNWCYIKRVISQGLVRRRAIEGEWILGPPF